MKKCLLLVLTWLLSGHSGFAQANGEQIGLDKKTFKTVLNQQFSNLITGQSKTGIGNFASLVRKEPERTV